VRDHEGAAATRQRRPGPGSPPGGGPHEPAAAATSRPTHAHDQVPKTHRSCGRSKRRPRARRPPTGRRRPAEDNAASVSGRTVSLVERARGPPRRRPAEARRLALSVGAWRRRACSARRSGGRPPTRRARRRHLEDERSHLRVDLDAASGPHAGEPCRTAFSTRAGGARGASALGVRRRLGEYEALAEAGRGNAQRSSVTVEKARPVKSRAPDHAPRPSDRPRSGRTPFSVLKRCGWSAPAASRAAPRRAACGLGVAQGLRAGARRFHLRRPRARGVGRGISASRERATPERRAEGLRARRAPRRGG
jgi:hypothetical protein